MVNLRQSRLHSASGIVQWQTVYLAYTKLNPDTPYSKRKCQQLHLDMIIRQK